MDWRNMNMPSGAGSEVGETLQLQQQQQQQQHPNGHAQQKMMPNPSTQQGCQRVGAGGTGVAPGFQECPELSALWRKNVEENIARFPASGIQCSMPTKDVIVPPCLEPLVISTEGLTESGWCEAQVLEARVLVADDGRIQYFSHIRTPRVIQKGTFSAVSEETDEPKGKGQVSFITYDFHQEDFIEKNKMGEIVARTRKLTPKGKTKTELTGLEVGSNARAKYEAEFGRLNIQRSSRPRTDASLFTANNAPPAPREGQQPR